MPTVELRPVVERDLELFFEHQDDEDAARMAAFASRDRDAFFAHWRRILDDETAVARTVVTDGEVAGNVTSWNADDHREVGYWLGRAHSGKGIATQALAAFVEIEQTRPLQAWIARHNAGSVRVAEKCGFVPLREESEHVVLELRLPAPG